MKSLSVDERKLLIIQGCDILAYSLAGVFVTVFFFSHSTLSTTALFRAITFASMVFFFALTGRLLKYISAGMLIKFSLGGGALYFLLLFLLREQSIRWYVPLGILDGAMGGIFWAAFNLYQYIVSSSGRRVAYFGWGQALFNLASAIGPTIGGLVIVVSSRTSIGLTGGYTILFLIVSIILGVTAFIVGKLPVHGDIAFSYKHLLTHKRSVGWKLVLGQQALLGLYDVSLGTVTSVLFFLIIQSESKLGILLTVGSLLATVTSIIVTRTLVKYPQLYWAGIFGSMLSIVVFAYQQNVMGMWLMIGIAGMTLPFMMTKLSAAYFDALDQAPGTWENKFHMMIERDGLLGLLRMISYIILFFILRGGNEITIARTWLYIIPVIPFAIGVLLALSSRRKKITAPIPFLPNENV